MADEEKVQVNTLVSAEIAQMLDEMCKRDERTRSHMVRWLIQQEYERRQDRNSLGDRRRGSGLYRQGQE